jgi:toxin CptA
MSIAVSAVIRPSHFLRAALYAFACLHVAAAVALALGALGPVRAPLVIATFCGAAGLVCLLILHRNVTTHQIDISGLGQIRLTVQQRTGVPQAPASGSGSDRQAIVSLVPGTTVWPSALLLLLADGAGKVTVLLVLPGSLEAGQFRPLAVAIRAIGSQKNTLFGTKKIL